MCRAALPAAIAPAARDGLDGELARLQDQSTGGMARLQPRAPALGFAALCPCGRSPRVRREPGAAVARQGLRAAGPATGSGQKPHGGTAQLWTVDAPRSDSALGAWGFCCAAHPRARSARP